MNSGEVKPSSLRLLIALARIPGDGLVEWTDEKRKDYLRVFMETCEKVFKYEFYEQFDGCNVFHHAVKAGNGLAVMNLKEFYTKRVNTDANAWQEYILIRDAEGMSVYDNPLN